MRNLSWIVGSLAVLLLLSPRPANTQSSTAATGPTVISADLGPCSALVTVTGNDAKPVYAAKVTTHIQYGFMGVKKLDLEAYTGPDGQVSINTLPETLKKPMYIYISKGDAQQMVEFKPEIQCHATFNVQLR